MRSVNKETAQQITYTSIKQQILVKNYITPQPKADVGSKIGQAKLKKPESLGAIAKAALPIATVAVAKKLIMKNLNTANSIIGTFTGNRFAENRIGSSLKAIGNPFNFAKNVAVESFRQTYEIRRQNERIDYNRQLAGMSLPYRDGNEGITL